MLAETRASVENDNIGFLDQLLVRHRLPEHSYRWPVLGLVPDIHAWKASDLRDYFDRGYGPGNCVMVAVGDVRAEAFFAACGEVLPWACAARFAPARRPPEPAQREERAVEVSAVAWRPSN